MAGPLTPGRGSHLVAKWHGGLSVNGGNFDSDRRWPLEGKPIKMES